MMWIAIFAVALALICWFFIRPLRYWIKKGVVQENLIDFLRNDFDVILRRQSQAKMVQRLYNIGSNTRYCVASVFFQPTFVLKDPDLIKQITVKDFDHFVDHRSVVPEQADPLFSKNLFSLKGQTWRNMRSTLSPAFTSSKMKYMFTLITQSGEQFVNHFLKQDKDLITVEMKDTFTRFTNDVIANTVFGVECDSLGQPKNEFYMLGRAATDFSGVWRNIKFFAGIIVPRLCELFGISFFSKDIGVFFLKVVKENISSREKHGIVRPDMINLLMEARKHGHMKYEESQTVPDAGFATVQEMNVEKNQKVVKTEITDLDITAQAFIFFFGGFDSVSSLMCFMSYELGVNPEVQNKLREEIDETRNNCKGKLTYEALTSMKYMDMVTCETLRKWPNAVGTDRLCTKPYTLQIPGEEPIQLEKGDMIFLPIYALHRDPQYFPDPDRFDPERFSDENKDNIKPYTYMPFGSGPRNCIGSRFALLETKILFFYILTHFEIVPVEKTRIPLEISKKTFNMTAEGGFWFGLKRRSK